MRYHSLVALSLFFCGASSATPSFAPVQNAYYVVNGTRRSAAAANDFPSFYHGQCGQDYVVSQVLRGKRSGFFVDLAANLPVYNSNTRALERDYDWTGLCIDGNEALMPALAAFRRCTPVSAIIGTEASTGAFAAMEVDPARPGMASVRKDRFCSKHPDAPGCVSNVVTLAQILDSLGAPRVIDYLSLDLWPDSQTAILLGFPFDRYAIHVITVEGKQPSAVQSRLRNAGFEFALENGWFHDQLWLHRDLPGGLEEGLRIANQSKLQWESTLRHPNWKRTQRGGPLPEKATTSPWAQKYVLLNCCGVPSKWLNSGKVPPAPSPEFEGLLAAPPCKCAEE